MNWDELQAKIEGLVKSSSQSQSFLELTCLDIMPQDWRGPVASCWTAGVGVHPFGDEDIRVNSDTRQVFADQILENIGRVGMNPMDIASFHRAIYE